MFNIAWLDKGDVLKNEVEEFIKNSADDIEYNLFIYHGIKELFFNSYIDFNLIIINQNIMISNIASNLVNFKNNHPNAEILLLSEKSILNEAGFKLTRQNQMKVENSNLNLSGLLYEKNSFAFFKTKNGYVKLNINDIICIETLNHQSLIHTKFESSDDKIIINKSLSNISGSINSSSFIRPHISYLVNMNYISSLEHEKFGTYIKLTNNLIVPITRDRKKLIVNMVKEYFHKNYIII